MVATTSSKSSKSTSPLGEARDFIAREEFLPYALPGIGEDEIAEVVDTLRSGWVTTGPKVKLFEAAFAEYVQASNAIAVNSCTAGLHTALAALGVGAGDEVLVPTLTFCSTANVVVHLGARPVLLDAGEDLNLVPEQVEAAITPKTRAIMPVHMSGQACDLAAILEIAERRGIAVVADAAHAAGSSYQGRPIGSDSPSLTSVFSFYATKNMTTGEGGMITTSDAALAERMRLLTLHGMSRDAWSRYTKPGSWAYEVVSPGFKYNMTDIQAALGIHQLRRLDTFNDTRRSYAAIYDAAFADLPELETPIVHSDRDHCYHLYVIRLDLGRLAIDRSEFIEELKLRNVGTSVHFIPVHLHPFYEKEFGYQPGDLPGAESLYERIISLPLYPGMHAGDVSYVAEAVRDVIDSNRI